MYRPAHELSRDQLQPDSHADYIFEQGQGTYWSDLPPTTKDYSAARDAIVRHIEEAVTSLAKK